ncbi:hypothetical protein Egran_06439 [Elaphomyces granulatus]|uniref:Sodium/calcium exchanger membrane region domain-containing protein n=1 Tax=Elaphomyces granulatus TaxID=519963 RepID=A0A232LNQ6_9EURO|nr:hypothetical protein Egran_06439 [Elaphomyces granulatus]
MDPQRRLPSVHRPDADTERGNRGYSGSKARGSLSVLPTREAPDGSPLFRIHSSGESVNILWPFVPAAIVLHFARPDLHVWVFTLNYIAIVPTANLIGFAGGELARKLPKAWGIVLETNLTSIVELVIFVILIAKDKDSNLITVIQAAILGSILANLLLCLGLCFFVGGINRDEQSFHEAISEVGSGLLLVAGFGLLIPSAFYSTVYQTGVIDVTELASRTRKISRATSVILLAAFVMYLWFNLRSHTSIFDDVLHGDEKQGEDRDKNSQRAKLTLTECIIAIIIALTCVTMSAFFLVEEIPFVVQRGRIPENFMGLILVPLVEKAAEHLTAIDEAWDNQINFALFHCLGPSIQTALLNAPLVVLIGWGLHKQMDLNFEIFMIVLLVLSILVVGNFLRDGKSNYLEGGLLVLVYIIVAVSTWYSKLENSGSLQVVLHNANLSATRPFLEDDIRNSIDLLKSSTAAIHRQTAILKSQCEDLRKELRNDKDARLDQDRTLAHLLKRHRFQKQHITAAADDIREQIEAKMNAVKEAAATERRQVLSWTTTRLKEHDRTFSNAERLLLDLESKKDDDVMRNRALELTSTLSRLVSEELYWRLDRMYMETILGRLPTSAELTEEDAEQIAGLEEELEALYPEIDALAEMSAKQQFGERILREFYRNRSQSQSISNRKLDEVSNMILEMTLSIETIRECLLDSQLYREALENFADTYRYEIGNQASCHPTKGGALRRDPLQEAIPNASQTTSTAEPSSLERFLRRLGVSGDLYVKSSGTSDSTDSLREKRHDILEFLSHLGIGADSPLAAHLNPTDQATELLESALHSDSSYAISLLDASQEESVSALEKKLGFVQKGVEGVNLDIIHERDKAQEKFLERWL